MDIGLRIKQLRLEKKLTQSDFSSQILITRDNLVKIELGKQNPTIEVLSEIVNVFNVEYEWLIEGKEKTVPKTVPNAVSNKENLEKTVKETKILQASIGIPLIPIEAMAGFGSAESVQVFENQITERYVIPEFTGKVDFFIRVYGSSMYPKYNSGDIVACKRIENLSFVQWNKTYVLDTTQGALVKRLIKSSTDGNIVCRSDNNAYSDFELSIDNDINAIALIVGVIRFE